MPLEFQHASWLARFPHQENPRVDALVEPIADGRRVLILSRVGRGVVGREVTIGGQARVSPLLPCQQTVLTCVAEKVAWVVAGRTLYRLPLDTFEWEACGDVPLPYPSRLISAGDESVLVASSTTLDERFVRARCGVDGQTNWGPINDEEAPDLVIPGSPERWIKGRAGRLEIRHNDVLVGQPISTPVLRSPKLLRGRVYASGARYAPERHIPAMSDGTLVVFDLDGSNLRTAPANVSQILGIDAAGRLAFIAGVEANGTEPVFPWPMLPSGLVLMDIERLRVVGKRNPFLGSHICFGLLRTGQVVALHLDSNHATRINRVMVLSWSGGATMPSIGGVKVSERRKKKTTISVEGDSE